MGDPIPLLNRDTKKGASAHRRGEHLYIYDSEADKADLLAIWSHDPAISKKAARVFKRRFMKPKGGWPWARKEPLEDETAPATTVGVSQIASSAFVTPHYPGQTEAEEGDFQEPVVNGTLPKIDNTFAESFAGAHASGIDQGVVLLEYQGFDSPPKVYLFYHYDLAFRHIKEHPDTREIMARASLPLADIKYGDYELACKQFASRTTTFFTLQVCPFK